VTKSRQRLFIADSLPISRGVPAERLRRRCPFGRPRNILRFNVFRSDSPLLLRSDLWLSLSPGWFCGLVCSLDSEGTPLVIGCSNFLGLRSSTGVPTCTRWRLCACPASSHRTLYRIKRCRGRIEFVERPGGKESRLHSVVSGTRLTGHGPRWPLPCLGQEPAVATNTSNQESSGLRATTTNSFTSSGGCWPISHTRLHGVVRVRRQLAHPLLRERKGLCLRAEEL
jgi:hypothetical protein